MYHGMNHLSIVVSKLDRGAVFCCSRLLGVWQLVYHVTQKYAEELKMFKGCDGWDEEEQMVSVIMSQIQTALQSTGESLEEGPSLLRSSG